jgi:hypothetical protein
MGSNTTTSTPTVSLTATPATDLDLVTSIITTSFASVPLTNTFINEISSYPPPYPSPLLTPSRRHAHFSPGILSGHASGSLILQAASYSAISIWEPPSYAGAPFTAVGAAGPLRNAWRERIEAAKARELQGKPFWHLAFLARNQDPAVQQVKGAVSAVVKPTLEEARRDKVPVWLEAVDERGVAIYTGWGFELVETVILGKSTHGADGWPVEGREGVEPVGVKGYCMVFRPWVREEATGA